MTQEQALRIVRTTWRLMYPNDIIMWTTIAWQYTHNTRKYHDIRHPAEMLQTLAALLEPTDHRDNIHNLKTAIILHDLYPDVTKSAYFTHGWLLGTGMNMWRALHIRDLIFATETHKCFDRDSALLIDCDLYRFLYNNQAALTTDVRHEYADVPEDAFNKGRAQILQGFLDRDRIYQTDMAHRLWEQKSRANLTVEIERLLT